METFMGVPRDKIDWCPTIDYEICNFCMECFDFCPHDVFSKSEEQKLYIKNPDNCVVFCRACSKTCNEDALTFPEKTIVIEKIKITRKELE